MNSIAAADDIDSGARGAVARRPSPLKGRHYRRSLYNTVHGMSKSDDHSPESLTVTHRHSPSLWYNFLRTARSKAVWAPLDLSRGVLSDGLLIIGVKFSSTVFSK
ncbi:hypothetical protein Y032_0003g1282 [Ancylostoma ceylanicum]|uniref:Uncharacterized protein n=1 Tax=Ancylostoma ceylanicum TaxID=53326 RepID=A0A016VXW3_9BILA|nr:hypothetical protein Y032_0003g1282 [Ancylostoma ceylanicum]